MICFSDWETLAEAIRGIRFEITHQLGLQGLTVVLTSRDTAVGEESAKVIQEGGLKVVFHQLDVIDQQSIDTFCSWIKENYGGIDILFNHRENRPAVGEIETTAGGSLIGNRAGY
ncbi:putative oxidoreductase [Helianthus annuus]|nr:putative oxidoreductase [Helianthus annuus]